jgi:hypothetical protein
MSDVSRSERFPRLELFNCTFAELLIKRYYVLFLISVFIFQVTNLAHFTYYNMFSKISPSASIHFATRVRTVRVARLSASGRSCMLAIICIMRTSNSSRVSTFILYNLLFIQTHKQKSKGRSTAGVKDNIGRQIQTHIKLNSSISETVRNRTHAHIQFLRSMSDTMTS